MATLPSVSSLKISSGKITWIVSPGKNILEINTSEGLILENKLNLKALGLFSPSVRVADISTTFDSIDLRGGLLLFNESTCWENAKEVRKTINLVNCFAMRMLSVFAVFIFFN